jgi:hypothetical protein
MKKKKMKKRKKKQIMANDIVIAHSSFLIYGNGKSVSNKTSILSALNNVGTEQCVCVYFPVRMSRPPFWVKTLRRTPGFYLGGCVPPRAVFCWHTILFAY